MSNWGFRSWETAEAFKAAQARQQRQAAKARRRAALQVQRALLSWLGPVPVSVSRWPARMPRSYSWTRSSQACVLGYPQLSLSCPPVCLAHGSKGDSAPPRACAGPSSAPAQLQAEGRQRASQAGTHQQLGRLRGVSCLDQEAPVHRQARRQGDCRPGTAAGLLPQVQPRLLRCAAAATLAPALAWDARPPPHQRPRPRACACRQQLDRVARGEAAGRRATASGDSSPARSGSVSPVRYARASSLRQKTALQPSVVEVGLG